MIVYEWCYEEVDEAGDIIDSSFQDKLEGFSGVSTTHTLVLVRNVGNEASGLEERLWAYVEDGQLPFFFSDAMERETGRKVPARFQAELDKFNKRKK